MSRGKTTTIPLTHETKEAIQADKAGRNWDTFVKEMHAVYQALGPVERAKLLQQGA